MIYKFDDFKECPKCGENITGTKWVPVRYASLPGLSFCVPEHLEKTCTRCGFIWKNKPNDYQGDQE